MTRRGVGARLVMGFLGAFVRTVQEILRTPLMVWGRRGFALLAIAFLGWLLVSQWDRVEETASRADSALLAIAVALFFGLFLINAWFWKLMLRTLGHDVGYAWLVGLTARTAPARYVPGGVWFTVGRMVALAERGVAAKQLGLIVLVEMFGAACISGSVGGALLLVGDRRLIGVAVLAASLVGTVLMVRWMRARGVLPSTVAGLGACFGLYWVTASAAFVCYCASLWAEWSSVGVVELSGIYLVSYTAGLLFPLAPQGMGVFEGVAAALLDASRLADFMLMVVGFRLVLLAADLSFWLAWVVSRAIRGSRATKA